MNPVDYLSNPAHLSVADYEVLKNLRAGSVWTITMSEDFAVRVTKLQERGLVVLEPRVRGGGADAKPTNEGLAAMIEYEARR